MNLSTEVGATSTTDEDEFKSMYHATYRASTFALRKYLKQCPSTDEAEKDLPPLLDKEKAMTYIDEFLRLFCEEN
jgi:formaldehyde-activating enzyme involved in methanogenesis